MIWLWLLFKKSDHEHSLLEKNELLFRSFTYKKEQFAQKPKGQIFNPGNYTGSLIGGALLKEAGQDLDQQERAGRLLNNPLGIFGHNPCSGQLGAGANLTGTVSHTPCSG